MKSLLTSISATAIALALSSSASYASSKIAPKLIECNTPRPQICTMQYDPVIGIDENGNTQEYSNGCSACSAHKIVGYYKKVEEIKSSQ